MARGPLALAPELDKLRQAFEQLSTEADALTIPLSDRQFSWRPTPEAWSIAECLDHLNATARNYLPTLDEAIGSAIRRGLYGESPFRYSWIGRLSIWLMEPPSRIRVKAPRLFQPAPNRARHEVMAAFRAYQVQFVDRLRQANGLDLGRARVSSPVAAWVRLSLGSAFALMVAHERRHLWQARGITRLEGFP
jgi:hypothetical protein